MIVIKLELNNFRDHYWLVNCATTLGDLQREVSCIKFLSSIDFNWKLLLLSTFMSSLQPLSVVVAKDPTILVIDFI